jgi:hypothetical protein
MDYQEFIEHVLDYLWSVISDTPFFHETLGCYCDDPESWQEMIINNGLRVFPMDAVLAELRVES